MAVISAITEDNQLGVQFTKSCRIANKQGTVSLEKCSCLPAWLTAEQKRPMDTLVLVQLQSPAVTTNTHSKFSKIDICIQNLNLNVPF